MQNQNLARCFFHWPWLSDKTIRMAITFFSIIHSLSFYIHLAHGKHGKSNWRSPFVLHHLYTWIESCFQISAWILGSLQECFTKIFNLWSWAFLSNTLEKQIIFWDFRYFYRALICYQNVYSSYVISVFNFLWLVITVKCYASMWGNTEDRNQTV